MKNREDGPKGARRRRGVRGALRRTLTTSPVRRFPQPPSERPPISIGALARQRADARADVITAFRAKLTRAGLTEEGLRQVVQRLLVIHVAEGEPIQAPGDTPEFLSVVGQGCMKTVAELRTPPPADATLSLTVQFAKPSYVAGMAPIAPLTEHGRFWAVAHTPSIVALASRDLMQDILAAASPAQRLDIFLYHARALSRLIYDKTLLLTLGVRERILYELWQLQRLFPKPGAPGRIDIPLWQQDIADLVSASREHVVRTLAALHDEGVLTVEGGRYVLLRPPSAGEVVTAPAGTPVVTRRSVARRRTSEASRLLDLGDRLGLPAKAANILVKGAELTWLEPGESFAPTKRRSVAVLVTGVACVMVDTPAGPAGAWIAKPSHFVGTSRARSVGAPSPAFRVTAINSCLVATLDGATMEDVLGMLTGEQLLRFMNYNHAALSRQLYTRCMMLVLGTKERLLYQLKLLANDFSAPAPDGTSIAVPIRPRRDLAPMIAADAAATSRALQQLQREGRVRMEGLQRLVVLGDGDARRPDPRKKKR